MNRLAIINFINPSWFRQITEFLGEHPDFNKLIPIVALDEYPNGFNRNPHETDEHAPLNIFETILYGLAFAGVDIDYGKQQYLLITDYLRKQPFKRDMEFTVDLQPEKIPVYRNLINRLFDLNMTVNDLVYENFHLFEDVEGMTESTTTLLHLLYDVVTSEEVLPYGDKQFKRGMSMFYELESPTKEELKAITATWRNKKVGLMFIIQFAHYSEYV